MVVRALRCDKLQFCAKMTVSTQTVCRLSDYLVLHGPNKAVRQKQKATVQGYVYLLLDFSRPYHLGICNCTLVYTVALLNISMYAGFSVPGNIPACVTYHGHFSKHFVTKIFLPGSTST